VLAYLKKNPNPDKKFIAWINKVEKIVFRELNMKLHDIQDQPYMMSYEDGFTPEQMAAEIIADMLI
jgi:hypothetical protein